MGDDNGEGWQTTVMDHCVNSMAIFGLRWMAHAYGPVGTIGEERSFLGSPELPGYPHHSTWPHFPGWNLRLTAHLDAVERRLPDSNVLVVFPVETLYSLAGPPADAAATEIFRLVLALLDRRFQVDVHSSTLVCSGRWEKGAFVLGDSRYEAVIFPFPDVVSPETLALMRKGRKRIRCMKGVPRRLVKGKPCALPGCASADAIAPVVEWLQSVCGVLPLEAPAGSWVTVTPLKHGAMVSLCPSRHGAAYSGRLQYRGAAIVLPESNGLTRVFFPGDGEPEIRSSQPA